VSCVNCGHEAANHGSAALTGRCHVLGCTCPHYVNAWAAGVVTFTQNGSTQEILELRRKVSELTAERDHVYEAHGWMKTERDEAQNRLRELEVRVMDLEAALPSGPEKPPEKTPEKPLENPKHAAGARKIPLHLVPPALEIAAARALAEGAELYGPYNWRLIPVRVTDYIAAIRRHAGQMLDGEDVDPESVTGKTHLEGLIACAAILADSIALEIAIDDRPPKGPAPRLLRDPQKLERARRAREAALVEARVERGDYDVVEVELTHGVCGLADTFKHAPKKP
jgi:hypothetical protein